MCLQPCHVFSYLIVFFSLGFSFLYFTYLLLVFLHSVSCYKMESYNIFAAITRDLIYTCSYFERFPSSSTNGVKIND